MVRSFPLLYSTPLCLKKPQFVLLLMDIWDVSRLRLFDDNVLSAACLFTLLMMSFEVLNFQV